MNPLFYGAYAAILSGLRSEARVLDGVNDIGPLWAVYGFSEVLGYEAGPEETARFEDFGTGVCMAHHIYYNRQWTAIHDAPGWCVWCM